MKDLNMAAGHCYRGISSYAKQQLQWRRNESLAEYLALINNITIKPASS